MPSALTTEIRERLDKATKGACVCGLSATENNDCERCQFITDIARLLDRVDELEAQVSVDELTLGAFVMDHLQDNHKYLDEYSRTVKITNMPDGRPLIARLQGASDED